MATKRDLKKTASMIIRDWEQFNATGLNKDRSTELARKIEEFVQTERTTNREKAFRVSAEGMYIRKSAGSYISKTEAERAIREIKRLTGKVTKKAKDVGSAA